MAAADLLPARKRNRENRRPAWPECTMSAVISIAPSFAYMIITGIKKPGAAPKEDRRQPSPERPSTVASTDRADNRCPDKCRRAAGVRRIRGRRAMAGKPIEKWPKPLGAAYEVAARSDGV